MAKTKAEYSMEKSAYAYELYKAHKFFKKSRAIICHNKELLLIRITYNDGHIHYIFPGGGVDPGETPAEAAVREAKEEYGVISKVAKFLGRQYYSCKIKYGDIEFKSNRIDHFYILDYLSLDENSPFGISGEFTADDRVYEKVALSIDDIKKLHHYELNNMSEKFYLKLIEYMESL
jgi:8-oxo-dGTP pyrophosphatase MutT (NUDIX family)